MSRRGRGRRRRVSRTPEILFKTLIATSSDRVAQQTPLSLTR